MKQAATLKKVENPIGRGGLDAFIDGEIVDSTQWPFYNWEDHPPQVFSNIHSKNQLALIKYATGKETVEDPAADADFRTKKYHGFVKFITKGDVRACHTSDCYGVIAQAFAFSPEVMRAEALNAMGGGQIKEIIKLLKNYCEEMKIKAEGTKGAGPNDGKKAMEKCYSKLNFLPEGLRKSYARLIVKKLKDRLEYAHPNLLTSVLSVSKACVNIQAETLAAIISDPARSKALTAECLEAATNLNDAKPTSKDLKHLPSGALSRIRVSLPDEFIQRLSSPQVEGMASQLKDSELPGRDIDLSKILEGGAGGLTKKVLLGRLNGCDPKAIPSTFLPDSVAVCKRLSSGLLKGISDEDAGIALGKLTATDLAHLSPTSLQDIITAYPSVCGHFDDATTFKDVNMDNPACFRNMAPTIQAKVILTAKAFHPDILQHVHYDQVKQWRVDIKDKSYSELYVFGGRPGYLVAEMIQKLGMDPDGDHPCAIINSFDIFKTVPALAANITTDCVHHSRLDFKTTDGVIPPRLQHLMPYTRLKKKGPEYFQTITQEILGLLISGRAFCGYVTSDIFDLIPLTALSGMTGECFGQLTFRDKLTKEQVQAFKPDVFKNVDAGLVPPATVRNMTKEQLLSACTDTKSNIGSSLAGEVIEHMSIDLLGALTSEIWRHAPVDAFHGIDTAEKLKAIPPSAMIYWTTSQVGGILDPVLVTLSEEQAKQIGISQVSDLQPVQLLANIGGMPGPILEVLNSRLPVEQRVSRAWAWWIWGLIVGGVVLMLGAVGAGYYYYYYQK
jgi:hypothetical protein